MGAEIKLLLLLSLQDRNTINNILLGPVFDTNETKSQMDVLALNHSLGIGTLVHDVDLCDDTDSSDTLGVDFPGHL